MAKESNRGRGGGEGRGQGSGRGSGGGGGSGSGSGSAGGRPPRSVPPNWPPHVTYLTRPVYTGIAPRQRQLLQTQPGDLPNAPASTKPLPEVPSTLRFGPSPLVEIRTIADPQHPACGQRGLFAAKALPAGSFVLPYLGVYHRGNVSVAGGRGGTNPHNKRESDYDLWLDRDADVAIDADRQGNEARFVNDYRGTGKARPNAEFREVWDPRRGERGIAVFVLPMGKRTLATGSPPGGIAKGDEILVSYGKGFWEMRQKEAEAATAGVRPGQEEAGEPGGESRGESSAAVPETTEAARQAESATSAAATTAAGQPGTGGASGAPGIQYISDRLGSLKVVAKIPRNVQTGRSG